MCYPRYALLMIRSKVLCFGLLVLVVGNIFLSTLSGPAEIRTTDPNLTYFSNGNDDTQSVAIKPVGISKEVKGTLRWFPITAHDAVVIADAGLLQIPSFSFQSSCVTSGSRISLFLVLRVIRI